jgi:hypothetical protein
LVSRTGDIGQQKVNQESSQRSRFASRRKSL